MEESSHFSKESLRFLAALKKNNRREWFQPRKAEFDALVQKPLLTLAELLNNELERVAPAYAAPNSAKTLNRIYRDIRFSTDKTPYRDHVSALFPHAKLGKKQGAAFFVSVSAKEAVVAGGLYGGETRHLQAVREYLVEHHAEFKKLLSSKPRVAMFGELQGEQLLRVPKQFGVDHPAADLLRRKQWMMWKKWTPEEITSSSFTPETLKAFGVLAPLVEFLNEPLFAMPVTLEPR